MSEKVEVKIFGQSYTITGDKTREEIEKIGSYVDDKMHLIAKVAEKGGTSGVAVLTAINITDEYFDQMDEMDRLRTANEQLEKDAAHYIKLWEDSKKNFMQSKDSMDKMKERGRQEDARFKELEDKCKEYENTIFDLQMENVQLKSELEKQKND
jgi:cell division protein ZapA (FtsZ GTPase activity inhibitor)